MPDDVDYANIVDGVLHSCSFRFPVAISSTG